MPGIGTAPDPHEDSALCAGIRVLVLDVDGVLTDGRITYTDAGDEIKCFHVRDGSGMKLWLRMGNELAIITGRRSTVVARRAEELGVSQLIQGADDKKSALDETLAKLGAKADEVCAVGDDLPDVPVFRRVKLAIAVADACPEAKAAARWISQTPGGAGAVREVIERILKAQGRWNQALDLVGVR